MEQPGACSTCVPDAFHKKPWKWNAAKPCHISKNGSCSTCSTKKQHTPASARVSHVVGLCGLFPGGTGTYPSQAKEEETEARRRDFENYPLSKDRSERVSIFYPAPLGQAEPAAVHRRHSITGQKPGPTSQMKRREEMESNSLSSQKII